MFVQHCLPCHRLDGGGNADIGPDLNRPMSPVEYFRPDLLRRYLREPTALRTWPGQGMPGFAESVLPAADLEALRSPSLRTEAPKKRFFGLGAK